MGNYDEALAMYQKSLSISESKHGSLPEMLVRFRASVARERLGFIYGIKGDWQKSLENHQEMLAIEEELSRAEPTNLDYARASATAFDHVGDAFRGLKNYPKALEYGQRGLAMYEGFLNKEPQNARGQKDVGDCSHHVAETLLAAGNYREELALLQQTLTVRRGLMTADPTNVEYPEDLAESLVLEGEGLSASGNWTKAIDVLQEARSISEPIVSSHRQRIDYRRGLARLYTDLGVAFATLQNGSEATVWYGKALELWTELQNQHVLMWPREMNMPKEIEEKLVELRAVGPHG
jgi:tetratricopeptide (TPR) repeat protein